jgi:hypothetical protein
MSDSVSSFDSASGTGVSPASTDDTAPSSFQGAMSQAKATDTAGPLSQADANTST